MKTITGIRYRRKIEGDEIMGKGLLNEDSRFTIWIRMTTEARDRTSTLVKTVVSLSLLEEGNKHIFTKKVFTEEIVISVHAPDVPLKDGLVVRRGERGGGGEREGGVGVRVG